MYDLIRRPFKLANLDFPGCQLPTICFHQSSRLVIESRRVMMGKKKALENVFLRTNIRPVRQLAWIHDMSLSSLSYIDTRNYQRNIEVKYPFRDVCSLFL